MKNKVLVVDDESVVLSNLIRSLGQEFVVCTAFSGEEGLTLLQSEQEVGVVVADFGMPGMDGLEFLRRVKENAPETVTIMLADCPSEELAIQAINRGSVSLFLTKPCHQQEFLSAVRKGMSLYQRLQERQLRRAREHRDLESYASRTYKRAIDILEMVLLAQVYEKPQTLSLDIRCDFTELDVAENAVDGFIGSRKEEYRYDWLVLYELLTNGMRHGGQLDPRQVLTLSLVATDNYLAISVKDPGRGFDWQTHIDRELDLEDGKEGGRGIALSQMLCDFLFFSERGSRSTAFFLRK